MKELILGGARSGKSNYAEVCAEKSQRNVIYIATAQALDEEMQQRIEHHQQHRPEHWTLIEEPLDLVSALKTHDSAFSCILVDCLTLWLSNHLCSEQYQAQLETNIDALIEIIPELRANVIFVSNEVSMGIVPMGELNREFVDQAGRLHQRLAEVCDTVTLMVAGIPSLVKGKNE